MYQESQPSDETPKRGTPGRGRSTPMGRGQQNLERWEQKAPEIPSVPTQLFGKTDVSPHRAGTSREEQEEAFFCGASDDDEAPKGNEHYSLFNYIESDPIPEKKEPSDTSLQTVVDHDRIILDKWIKLWRTSGQTELSHLEKGKDQTFVNMCLLCWHSDIEWLKKNKIKVGQKIGSGGFGTVYQAQVNSSDHSERQSNEVAIKINYMGNYRRDGLHKAIQLMILEADIVLQLDHPNIVKRINIYNLHDMKTDFPCLIRTVGIMELMKGNLRQYVETYGQQDTDRTGNMMLTEQQAKVWFRQIVSGLQYMHNKGFVHCDIKLENILYNETASGGSVFKLSDHGLSMTISRTSMHDMGSSLYQAPEAEVEGPKVFVYPYDIYALGVSLIYTVAGMMSEEEVYNSRHFPHRLAEYVVINCGCSQALGYLFSRMCCNSVDQRMDIHELAVCPYLTRRS